MMIKEKYAVTGMTCSACSSHVEKSVGKLQGMEKVSVNLLTNSMQVEYDETVCDPGKIIAAVEKGGYGASLMQGGVGAALSQQEIRANERNLSEMNSSKNPTGREALKGEKQNRAMQVRLLVSVVFMIFLMAVSMHHMFFMWLGIPVPAFLHDLFHGNENAITFAFTQ